MTTATTTGISVRTAKRLIQYGLVLSLTLWILGYGLLQLLLQHYAISQLSLDCHWPSDTALHCPLLAAQWQGYTLTLSDTQLDYDTSPWQIKINQLAITPPPQQSSPSSQPFTLPQIPTLPPLTLEVQQLSYAHPQGPINAQLQLAQEQLQATLQQHPWHSDPLTLILTPNSANSLHLQLTLAQSQLNAQLDWPHDQLNLTLNAAITDTLSYHTSQFTLSATQGQLNLNGQLPQPLPTQASALLAQLVAKINIKGQLQLHHHQPQFTTKLSLEGQGHIAQGQYQLTLAPLTPQRDPSAPPWFPRSLSLNRQQLHGQLTPLTWASSHSSQLQLHHPDYQLQLILDKLQGTLTPLHSQGILQLQGQAHPPGIADGDPLQLTTKLTWQLDNQGLNLEAIAPPRIHSKQLAHPQVSAHNFVAQLHAPHQYRLNWNQPHLPQLHWHYSVQQLQFPHAHIQLQQLQGDLSYQPQQQRIDYQLNTQAFWQSRRLPDLTLSGQAQHHNQQTIAHSKISSTSPLAVDTTLTWDTADHLRLDWQLIPNTWQGSLTQLVSPWPWPLELTAGQWQGQGQLNMDLATPDAWQLNSQVELSQLTGAVPSALINQAAASLAMQANAQGLQLQIKQATIAQLDAGTPLQNIALTAQLDWPSAQPKPQVELHSLGADWLSGHISAPATQLDFNQPIQTLTLNLTEIDLGQLLALEQQAQLSASGSLSGQLPLYLSEQGVQVDAGQIQGHTDGGHIALQPLLTPEHPAYHTLAPALNALENFTYHQLDSQVTYSNNGDLTLALFIAGANPDFKQGHPVEFNINLTENIPALLESLRIVNGINDQIEKMLSP